MEIRSVNVVSGDGEKNRLTVFQPPQPEKGVIIIMPALGTPAAVYRPFAENLAGLGWVVMTADLRGHGDSSVRASRSVDFGYQDMVAQDWPAVVGKAEELYPGLPLVLMGHSLGGQLNVLYASAEPDRLAALVLVAACSVYYRGWPFPRNIGLWAASVLIDVVSGVLGYFPGRKLGFGGREARSVMRDWSRTARTGNYDRLSGSRRDYDRLMAHTELPVLSVSFSDDSYAPEKACGNLCRKMPRARTARWHFNPSDIGSDHIGHYGWIKSGRRLAEKISGWLDGELAAGAR